MDRTVTRQKSYTYEQKCQIIREAQQTNAPVVAATSGIHVSSVRRWCQNDRQIAAEARANPSRKKRLRQNIEFIRSVEARLVGWIGAILPFEGYVLKSEIRKQAWRLFSATQNPRDVKFKASDGWARNFMKRNFPDNFRPGRRCRIVHRIRRRRPAPAANRMPFRNPRQLLGCSIM